MGLGRIARKFAADLQRSDQAILHGVASRDKLKALSFSIAFKAEHAYSSYHELATDPEIDIIYIATPHVFHMENTLMCLEHGKHVLCEKPLGMNSHQVNVMTEKATEKGLFLMEGLWTRFIPITEKLIELTESKILGTIQHIRTDFGFVAPYHATSRLFNKSLGGGSLLDIGIYPVYMSNLLFGTPSKVSASMEMSNSGIDAACSIEFSYDLEKSANLYSTFLESTSNEATIHGDLGKIKIHAPFHHSEHLTIETKNHDRQLIHLPIEGNGYVHEIEEVHQCLNLGKQQSQKHSLEDSLLLIKTLDQVRRKIGLVYDDDKYV